MPDDDVCSSEACGAAITWAVTDAGKRIPIDPEPVPNGNLILTELAPGQDLRVRYLRKGEDIPALAPRYQAHFVTCPEANRFRRSAR